MTFRSFLYSLAKLIGDLNGLTNHPTKRIKRRTAGKYASKILRKL